MKKIKATTSKLSLGKFFFTKEFGFLLLLFILSLPSILPLLHPGFFVTDDGEWMIIRLSAFFAALRDGQIPVRILERLNFGYGYPVSEFLYPGAFYFASLLHGIKFGFINAIKITMLFSLLGSAVFTYLWLKNLFSRSASLIGALFALYIPYHLYDIYTRGSVGELFALVWVPFILWMIEKRNIFFTSLGICLLILAHNTLALLFLPVIIMYWFLRKISTVSAIVMQCILGIGLAAFFYLPIAFDLSHTVFSQTAVSDPLKYFADFTLVGVSVIVVLGLVSFTLFTKKQQQKKSITVFFLLLSLLSLIAATALSTLFWKIIPANFVQFPFRFLSYLIISLAFLAAYTIDVSKQKFRYVAIGILLIVLVVSAFPYSSPKNYFQKDEGYYYTNDATTTVKDEYMPLWVKQKPLQRPEKKVTVMPGTGDISEVVSTSKKISFTANIKKDTQVRVNTIYWPGWRGYVDGVPVTINYQNVYGVMDLPVPSGKHTIMLSFQETSYRLVSDLLSLASLLLLIYYTRKSRLNTKN